MILSILKGRMGKGKYTILKCDNCNKLFERNYVNAINQKFKKHFCSRKCIPKKYNCINIKSRVDCFKKEIIDLSKITSTYGEMQEIMRNRHPEVNKNLINFSRWSISKKLKEWGITKKEYIIPSWMKNPDNFIDTIDELMATTRGQVFIGTLLGDGTIHKKNKILQIIHCNKQKKYLIEKNKLLDLEMKTRVLHEAQKKAIICKKICNIQKAWVSWSRKYPFIAKIRKDFYPNGKKILNLDYLSRLNVLGLFIWIYDDGSLRYRPKPIYSSEIVISTKGFNHQELIKSSEILINNFKLDKISISKNNTLSFNRKSQIILCDLFIKNIPLSLLKTIKHKHNAILEILESNTSSKKAKRIGGDAR